MYKVQQNEAKAYEKLSGNLDMDISIMINSKQRRHIHEKWQFGQGGPGVAQGVPRGGKSLGGAGGRGKGWRGMGMGTKTTFHEKWQLGLGRPGVAQRVPQGGKSHWGEGRGVAVHDTRSATATVTWTAGEM